MDGDRLMDGWIVNDRDCKGEREEEIEEGVGEGVFEQARET